MNGITRAALVTGAAAAGAVVLDQGTKALASRLLEPGRPVDGPLGTGLNLAENRTPLNRGGSLPEPLLWGAGATLAVAAVGGAIALRRPPLLLVGAGLMAGGAVSNIADRSLRGGVVDFVRTPIGEANVADAALGVGALMVGTALALRRWA